MSGTGLRYRTPLEVRSIPNGLWEKWLRTDGVPWTAFSSDALTQKCLRHVVKANARRIGASLDR